LDYDTVDDDDDDDDDETFIQTTVKDVFCLHTTSALEVFFS